MSAAITHRVFLGDAERDFALTAAVLPELERLTGSGLTAVYLRVGGDTSLLADIVETIRLGLIGAGEAPAEAARLVRLYVEDRPLMEVLPVAFGILNARLYGRAPVEPVEAPAPVVEAPEPGPAELTLIYGDGRTEAVEPAPSVEQGFTAPIVTLPDAPASDGVASIGGGDLPASIGSENP